MKSSFHLASFFLLSVLLCTCHRIYSTWCNALFIGHTSHEAYDTLQSFLNGQPLYRPWITHEEIMQGGTLSLDMDTRPNPAWGANCPPLCAPTALPIRN